jgi:putative nucleotidyltransferase with HDIG domain/diguanylate cyclase (GGDEF)-like protein
MDTNNNDTALLTEDDGWVARLRGLLRRQPHTASSSLAAALDGPPLAEVLDLELERAKRGGRPLSLLIGEIPSSATAVEERIAGQALAVVEAVVSREKRRIDTVTRAGEGRFALVLPETGEQGALRLADRLRAAIARALADDRPSVSFGIATFPRHGRSAAALTTAAARALQAVHALGGDDALLESAEATATMVSVGVGDADSDRRLEALLAIAETVDIRDHGRPGHAQTVARYGEQIARELGLPVKVSDRVRLAGLLHDIGKVAVPEEVLHKPGPLDERERELVRGHAEIGARLIDRAELTDVREWVLAHHERPDGEGYPRGLSADATPLEARILAVADAYEAMTSTRPYRPALSHESAQSELGECSGTQFDKRVVQAFLRILEREGLRSRSRPPVSAG